MPRLTGKNQSSALTLLAVLFGVDWTGSHATAASLGIGEVVVADFQGAVYRVDPSSGGIGLVGMGGAIVAPFNAVPSANGRIVYIADQNAAGGSVIRVDLVTNVQTTLASGDSVHGVDAVALGADNYLYAVRRPGPVGPAAIVRVDTQTGAVTPVSTGGMLSFPRDIEFAPDGTLLVLEALYVNGGALGAVVRIDISSGSQTIVSSGGYFQGVQGIGTAVNGLIYVVDSFAADRILRIDAATGQQGVVSEGGMMCLPRDVAVERNGNLLVSDGCASVPCSAGTCVKPSILRINPQDGKQAVLTSDGSLQDPSGVVIFKGGNVTASTPISWGAMKAIYR